MCLFFFLPEENCGEVLNICQSSHLLRLHAGWVQLQEHCWGHTLCHVAVGTAGTGSSVPCTAGWAFTEAARPAGWPWLQKMNVKQQVQYRWKIISCTCTLPSAPWVQALLLEIQEVLPLIHMINLDLWVIFWACWEFLTSWGIDLVLHKLPGYLLRRTYVYPLLCSQLEIRLSFCPFPSWGAGEYSEHGSGFGGGFGILGRGFGSLGTFSPCHQPLGWPGPHAEHGPGLQLWSCIPAASLLHWGTAKLEASYPDWGLQSAWVIEILNNSVINDFVKALLCLQEYW